MSSTIYNLTLAGRIKKPSYSTVATWVKESWDEVDENIIRNSFKCYEISTKTDGSEDDCLFDYDVVAQIDLSPKSTHRPKSSAHSNNALR